MNNPARLDRWEFPVELALVGDAHPAGFSKVSRC